MITPMNGNANTTTPADPVTKPASRLSASVMVSADLGDMIGVYACDQRPPNTERNALMISSPAQRASRPMSNAIQTEYKPNPAAVRTTASRHQAMASMRVMDITGVYP